MTRTRDVYFCAALLALAGCGQPAADKNGMAPANDGTSEPGNVVPAAAPADGDGQGDALVNGTDFNATAKVPCFGVSAPDSKCSAGVLRSPDQIAVDVMRPNGLPRALLFDGQGVFVTASTAQADGSAA